MTAFDRAWAVVKNDDIEDVFYYPPYNLNPHFQPDYPYDDDKCETEGCPNPARTGEMTYSGGYIGKVTVCNECWNEILRDLEENHREGEG